MKHTPKVILGLMMMLVGPLVSAGGLILWLGSGLGGYDRLGQPLDEDLQRQLGRSLYDLVSFLNGLGGAVFFGIAILGIAMIAIGWSWLSFGKVASDGASKKGKCLACLRTFSEEKGEACPLCGRPLEGL